MSTTRTTVMPTPKALRFLVETMAAKDEDVESPEAIAWLKGLSKRECSQALADRGKGTPDPVAPDDTLQQLGLEDAPPTVSKPPKPWADWQDVTLKLPEEDRLKIEALKRTKPGVPIGYITGQYVRAGMANDLL